MKSVDPRIALRDRARRSAPAARETADRAARCSRAAAVVQQADDRPNAERRSRASRSSVQRQSSAVEAVRRDAFPEHRIAQRADAERGERGRDRRSAASCPLALELIETAIADPVDRALDAAPDLEQARPRGAHVSAHDVAPRHAGDLARTASAPARRPDPCCSTCRCPSRPRKCTPGVASASS